MHAYVTKISNSLVFIVNVLLLVQHCSYATLFSLQRSNKGRNRTVSKRSPEPCIPFDSYSLAVSVKWFPTTQTACRGTRFLICTWKGIMWDLITSASCVTCLFVWLILPGANLQMYFLVNSQLKLKEGSKYTRIITTSSFQSTLLKKVMFCYLVVQSGIPRLPFSPVALQCYGSHMVHKSHSK